MSALTAVFRRFWRYAKGDRHRLVLGGLGSLVVFGCELGTVIVFSVITDRVLDTRHLAAFWGLAAWWLGIVAVAAVAMFAAEYETRWPVSGSRCGCRMRCSRTRNGCHPISSTGASSGTCWSGSPRT